MAGNGQCFGKTISNVDHAGNEDDAELELLDAVPKPEASENACLAT